VIEDAQHFPLVPRSTNAVSVTCRAIDDHPGPLTVEVHYRVDGAASFSTLPMFDDGVHGDALANDAVFGTSLPLQANGTIVEFYFTAADNTGQTRTWPAPARDYNGAIVQSQNCLYQVDDTPYAGAMPIYYLIMRAADKSELTQINTNSPGRRHSPSIRTKTTIKHRATPVSTRRLSAATARGKNSGISQALAIAATVRAPRNR
jgi:hypothetical protein